MVTSASAVAGQPGTVTVVAHDGAGAPVPSFAGTVIVTSSDPQAQVPPVYTFTLADQGSHQFANALTLRRAGSTRIDATDTSLTAAPGSATVTVTAGQARQFAIAPTNNVLTATQPTVITVSALDAVGNVATGYSGSVHFTSSDANAVLPTDTPFGGGDLAARAVRLALATAGSQSVTVADAGDPTLGAATYTFTVNPGPAAQLRFIQAPQTGSACAALDAVQVQVRDAGGNPLSNPNLTVGLSLGAGVPGLGGTLLQAVENGNALFSDLTVGKALQGQWTASATGLSTALGPVFVASDSAPQIVQGAAPSGSSCLMVPYTLQQTCGAAVDIDVAYSLDGINYLPATQAGLRSAAVQGRVGVPSNSTGLARAFLWDASHDLGAINTQVDLRILGRSRGLQGTAAVQAAVPIALGMQWAARTDVATGAAQSCIAVHDFNHDGQLDVATCQGDQVALRLSTGQGTFADPNLYTLGTGTGPRVLLTADVNRDGQGDLLAVNTGTGTLTLLAGSATGGLTPGSVFSVGNGAVAAALGDIDRDGRLDFVTLTLAGNNPTQVNLNWAAGNGNGGTSSSPNTLSLVSNTGTLLCSPGNCSAQRLALADMDEDGLLDALVVEEVHQQLLLARGTGTGFAQVTATATQGAATTVATADLDADGHTDVVVSSADGAVQVFLGLGNGGLQTARAVLTSAPPASLSVGDVDGDGNLDVTLLSSGGAAVLLLGDGRGNLTQSSTLLAMPSNPTMTQLVDVNGDAQLDLLTSSGAAVSTTLSQRARPCSWNLQTPQSLPAGSGPNILVLGDFDSDGKADLWASQNSNTQAALLLGDGAGQFVSAASVTLGGGVTAAQAHDVNADGRLDILALSPGTGMLQTLLGNGNATFNAAALQSAGSHPVGLAVADLDADGDLDAVVVSDTSPGTVTLLFNDGSGAWVAGTPYTSGNQPRWVAAADLNGDGHPDLLTANLGASLSLLTGTGTGAFSLPTTGSPMDTGPVGLALVDVNGDGRLDVLTASGDTASVGLRLGQAGATLWGAKTTFALASPPTGLVVQDFNGDGAVDWLATQVAAQLALGTNVGGGLFNVQIYSSDAGATSAVANDINSDGSVDVVTANPNSNHVTVLRGDTGTGNSGQLLAPRLSHIGSTPQRMVITDLNRDGHLDVLTANAGSSSLTFTPGSARGLAADSISVATGSAVTGVAVGDLNRDGWPDVITQSKNDNAMTVHISSRGGELGVGVSQVTCAAAELVCLADFNRDGLLDVAVPCPQTKNILLLLGHGDGTFLGQQYWPAGAPLIPQFNDLVCRDLDRDGATDILVTDGSNGRLLLFLGDGSGSYQTPQIASGLLHPTALAVGDVNHDGRLDVVLDSNTGVALALGQPGATRFPTPWSTLAPSAAAQTLTLADANADGLIDLLLPNAAGSTLQVLLGDGTTLQPGPVLVSGAGALQAGLGDTTAAWGRRDVWVINRQDSVLSTLRAE